MTSHSRFKSRIIVWNSLAASPRDPATCHKTRIKPCHVPLELEPFQKWSTFQRGQRNEDREPRTFKWGKSESLGAVVSNKCTIKCADGEPAEKITGNEPFFFLPPLPLFSKISKIRCLKMRNFPLPKAQHCPPLFPGAFT